MKVLILEDDPARHRAFRKNMYDPPVIVVTAPEAITRLAEETWDALFLDHDLGGEVFVPSGPGTGYEVACWLEEHPDRQPPRIFLHSLNPTGRARMKAALPAALESPFAWLGIAGL